ncbi:hypothetical protein NDU88_001160 [Pleurodeles waltl]|uniref:Uncharacterized protein n=1 Tax=Pleurodeles waltl TaxID=8319 RepID=A0AAV7V729_PLEWA|nr:hypothetical protein NDU88_001160 [Pleurodeles waltl]
MQERVCQKTPPGPLERGVESTGAQILAAIESSSRVMQTQIAAIAVDANLLRADLRVLHAGRSHFFQSPEAVWGWMERNNGTGTPEFLRGGVVGDLEGWRKCILQHAEVPDTIMPAVEAE